MTSYELQLKINKTKQTESNLHVYLPDFSAGPTAFDSKTAVWLPTSRLMVPTIPGSHESLDGTSTGSDDEKQTVDEEAGATDTEELPGLGMPCASPVPNVMVSVLSASVGDIVLPNSLTAMGDEVTLF